MATVEHIKYKLKITEPIFVDFQKPKFMLNTDKYFHLKKMSWNFLAALIKIVAN